MEEAIIIDCPQCDTKVRAEILVVRKYDLPNEPGPFKMYFLECPSCQQTMVACSELVQVAVDGWEYDSAKRLWPRPKRLLDYSIPESVRKSVEEARLCLKVKAFSACAVMCGRALEAMCRAQGAQNWQLAKGLDELKKTGVIDGRLFEWGNSLRERRNIGAHATDDDVSREDAIDVLDFTLAICDYIYVLTNKYNRFKARESSKK